MLENKVVVITGAGSGLGRALCLAFVSEGCVVVGLGRTQSTLEATAELADSERFSFLCADVSLFDPVSNAIESIIADHGRVDILFNNAAIYKKVSFISESAQEWAETMSVNVNGPANCCKAVLPHMLKAGGGKIFNVGSFADIAPIPNSAAYSCSKGAVHALSKSIAADISDSNVEVHEWIPGHLNTQMSDFTGIDPAISAGWAVQICRHDATPGKALVFMNDSVLQPPRGLKEKIKARLFFWRNSG